MSMVVRTNINSMNANRNLSINNSQVATSLEKLASGYAINRAADDASGLAVSEKMRAQITGLDQGTENALDGVCLIQTAEGAMDEIHNMLNRITELATKSANGTIQDEVDREAIQAEVDVLINEIDRIAQATNYNGIPLLDGSLAGCDGSGSTGGADSTDGTTFVSNLNIDTSKVVTVGNFTITGGVESVDFSYSGGILTILSDTDMCIDGGNIPTNSNIIVSDSAGSANLILKDIDITPSFISSYGSAFYTGNNKVYIELEGENKLTSTNYGSAALNVDQYGEVIIDGAGTITVDGGERGPGIGIDASNGGYIGGDITINGGTIIAIGDDYAAGIGPGYYSKVGNITINDGTVTATGGIGSAFIGTVGDITITGGDIIAISTTEDAAGIGTGDRGRVNSITITGGNITAIGGDNSAGIGSGYYGTVGDITYVEEIVTATGGINAEDIGEGYKGTVGTITIIPLESTDNETKTIICGQGLILHVADQNEEYNKIKVYIDPMTGEALEIKPLYVDTQEAAGAAIDKIRNAINYVSENRGNLGALQNRLERTINNNNNTSENMSSAKSTIKDCDMAKEMIEYTKMNVLTQSAQSMLAQSNQAPQSILELLG